MLYQTKLYVFDNTLNCFVLSCPGLPYGYSERIANEKRTTGSQQHAHLSSHLEQQCHRLDRFFRAAPMFINKT